MPEEDSRLSLNQLKPEAASHELSFPGKHCCFPEYDTNFQALHENLEFCRGRNDEDAVWNDTDSTTSCIVRKSGSDSFGSVATGFHGYHMADSATAGLLAGVVYSLHFSG